MTKILDANENELNKIISYLNEVLPLNAVVFLRGDLASGKTTLTQAVAKYKGVTSEVTSPTFSLQQCYSHNFYHYDLYRIDYDEFMAMGLFEEFEKEGWHFVEWGSDELKSFLKGFWGYDTKITQRYT